MSDKKEISLIDVLEILDKLEFFNGQRAGRLLWTDKPAPVQVEDINNFNRDISIIREFLKDNFSIEQGNTGTNIKLPCNIGDTLYYIGFKCDNCEEDDCYGCPYNRNGEKRDERFVHEFKVEQFRVRDNSIHMVNTDAIYASYEISLDIKEFGNTIFYTKEEASNKLKEINNKA